MRAFLCGPFAAQDRAPFVAAEQALRLPGRICFGPHDITYPAESSDYERARLRMKLLADCDTVVLLDGYTNDPVAAFEAEAARHLGMRIVPLVILLSAP